MKICNSYSHNGGMEILKSNNSNHDLIEAVENCNTLFRKGSPYKIKREMDFFLTSRQWVDQVRVGKTRLTISFMKNKIGVCFQIGNVARTYADILKLNHLGNKRIIDVGIIFVPHEIESKSLGANYASFDRLKNEIILFQDEIKTPLVIYGISN